MFQKTGEFGGMLKSALWKRKRTVPFYQKYYLLWTAPLTKFWTTQVCTLLFPKYASIFKLLPHVV